MGARTNFTFHTTTGDLTLYSHWGGESKASDLAHAINAAKPRWTDESYSLRIMISNLIGPNWDSETGYGLFVGDEGGEEEYQPISVDLTNSTVNDNGNVVSFDQFINYYMPQLALSEG